ncbi:hypothetical protein Tco_1071763 [Tanacetum coccineum]
MLKRHKVMDVYVEIVEQELMKVKVGCCSASESDNDFEDEEHVVQEVEVNMGYFNFQVEDASTGTDGNMIPVAPKVNLTEDNIEVLEFDSLESDLEDVPENDRSSWHVFGNYKVPGPNVDNAVKGKIVNEDAEEDKITCPWLLYLSKGDKGKWDKAFRAKLKRCNPDTTVKIDVYGEEDPESPTRLFRRIYAVSRTNADRLGVVANMASYPQLQFHIHHRDRQKGLLPALEKLFPHAEHRHTSLGRAHCDLLINNICEVFNRQLLEARVSPIITALTCEGKLHGECIVDWNGADLNTEDIIKEVVIVRLTSQGGKLSKGGTSIAATQASTGSPPLKRNKDVASRRTPVKVNSHARFNIKIIDLSSSIEAQIDGSEPGNEGSSMPHLPLFGSVGRPRLEVPADIAKRFKEGDITRDSQDNHQERGLKQEWCLELPIRKPGLAHCRKAKKEAFQTLMT